MTITAGQTFGDWTLIRIEPTGKRGPVRLLRGRETFTTARDNAENRRNGQNRRTLK